MYDPGGAKTLTLVPATLTANRTFTFPDLSGTLMAAPSPLTNGQLLIGSTGFNPVQTTLSAGAGIIITNGAGSITIASNVAIGTGGFAYTANPDPAPTVALSNNVNANNDVMMGLGTAAGGGTSITIVNATRMLIAVCGDVDNNTNNDGVELQIRYGVLNPPGSLAPLNGAAATGTIASSIVKYVGKNALSDRVPINLNGIGSGLIVGTTYWIDVIIGAINGGQARIRDITVSAIEF